MSSQQPQQPGEPVILSGLTPEPLTLYNHQIHGDRKLLLTQPQSVRLELRPARSSAATTTAVVPAPLHWRPFTGRNPPDSTEVVSPTLFQGKVYRCFQHALLAVLLWSQQGDSPPLRVEARTHSTVPFLILDASTAVLFDDNNDAAVDDRCLLLHLLSQEPSQAELTDLEEVLRVQDDPPAWGLLLLVGQLRPVSSSPSSSSSASANHQQRPPLHGILIRNDPCAEHVQHGWYPCLHEGRLRFVYQSRYRGTKLAPLMPPHLAALNLRLWRKGQATFSVGPRHITMKDTGEWDDRLRCQLLEAARVAVVA